MRSKRGKHSEVGKVELGPYIRGKDDSCSKKSYTSPLNSPPSLKIRRACREPPGRTSRPSDTPGRHITTYRTTDGWKIGSRTEKNYHIDPQNIEWLLPF